MLEAHILKYIVYADLSSCGLPGVWDGRATLDDM